MNVSQPVLLINSNRSRPPVSPVGLEYVGHALLRAGIAVEVLDLAFAGDWQASLAHALRGEPRAVGISFRNTDDCCYATGESFVPWIQELVGAVKRLTAAPVVLGGVGFSVFPERITEIAGAHYGIAGDGEEALPLLLRALAELRPDLTAVPNLVNAAGGTIVCNARASPDPALLPLPQRRLFDNPRYQREGAMVGIETKRGCPGPCLYCADPVSRGRQARCRPPQTIVAEIEDLSAQGVSWFHLCDSEFNLPEEHARAVCRGIIEAGLASRIQWYCYCAPVPFGRELAMLMRRAGCAGVNFGVDSMRDEQLAGLGRTHRMQDVRTLLHVLRDAGLNFIFDLMAGGPGETEKTLAATVQAVQRLDVPLAGIALGVRLYPGTALWSRAAGELRGGLRPQGADGLLRPLFYLSPGLGADPCALLRRLTGGQPRFMLLEAPGQAESYNYVGAGALEEAIKGGARGAYWDILRRIRGAPGN